MAHLDGDSSNSLRERGGFGFWVGLCLVAEKTELSIGNEMEVG